MTVAIHGQTREDIRQVVHEYYLQPHRTKAAWLASQSVPSWKFRQWRKMVFEGDLDRNLVPRDHGGMVRTQSERSAFEKAHAREIAGHQLEVEQLKDRIRVLEGSNTALGKAIGLLHDRNVPGSDTKQTNDPKSS